jgi:hypothetical protein
MGKEQASKPLQYKFLNMDSQEFLATGEMLAAEFKGKRHLVRMIPALPEYNQILCAAGTREFTAREAVTTCRKLTGVIK